MVFDVEKNKNAFSLIELMVVIAIVGVLAAVAIPTYKQYILIGTFNQARQAIATASTRAVLFQSTGSEFPTPQAIGIDNIPLFGGTYGFFGGDCFEPNICYQARQTTCPGALSSYTLDIDPQAPELTPFNFTHIDMWFTNIQEGSAIKNICVYDIAINGVSLTFDLIPGCYNYSLADMPSIYGEMFNNYTCN